MPSNAVSVRQLNLYVKSLLEGDSRLRFISVTGEISNFKRHYSSGHCYFTLKDDAAAVRCVMFRSAALKVGFEPTDGMSVTVSGRISLYEKDGQYQFYAEEMHKAGEGDLAAAFERLKKQLAAEGLFDTETKRPIPRFPRKVAVVTSETGAAVRDILNILSRRWPLCEVVLCGVSVQGENAASEMIAALDRLYALDKIDTIIIGRGGGSAEDLSAFNDEGLARKLYESPVPVISAVGHETDFTICDFVADLRAPTPSAAAELAVPDKEEVAFRVYELRRKTERLIHNKYELLNTRYNAAAGASRLARPLDMITTREQMLDILCEKLLGGINDRIKTDTAALGRAAAALDALSPLKTLARGFAAVDKNGCAVRSVGELSVGDDITLTLSDGRVECGVKGRLDV